MHETMNAWYLPPPGTAAWCNIGSFMDCFDSIADNVSPRSKQCSTGTMQTSNCYMVALAPASHTGAAALDHILQAIRDTDLGVLLMPLQQPWQQGSQP